MSERHGKIREYLCEVLLAGTDVEVTNETSLTDAGIIDSYTATQLAEFLSEEFGVAVPPDDLRPENFASVNMMAELVAWLKGK